MTGNAVVTTRLSRATMNRAIAVIAKVQAVERLLGRIDEFPLSS